MHVHCLYIVCCYGNDRFYIFEYILHIRIVVTCTGYMSLIGCMGSMANASIRVM